ncbi:hypothetical protein BC828DRAFT_414218 [Blastocladiella britannica]|nr:hypothetical protein BC828DRAFT_414218 [Blastocladiella britannica]
MPPYRYVSCDIHVYSPRPHQAKSIGPASVPLLGFPAVPAPSIVPRIKGAWHVASYIECPSVHAPVINEWWVLSLWNRHASDTLGANVYAYDAQGNLLHDYSGGRHIFVPSHRWVPVKLKFNPAQFACLRIVWKRAEPEYGSTTRASAAARSLPSGHPAASVHAVTYKIDADIDPLIVFDMYCRPTQDLCDLGVLCEPERVVHAAPVRGFFEPPPPPPQYLVAPPPAVAPPNPWAKRKSNRRAAAAAVAAAPAPAASETVIILDDSDDDGGAEPIDVDAMEVDGIAEAVLETEALSLSRQGSGSSWPDSEPDPFVVDVMPHRPPTDSGPAPFVVDVAPRRPPPRPPSEPVPVVAAAFSDVIVISSSEDDD